MAKENKKKIKDIYGIFDDFLKKTVVEKKSYFPESASEQVFKKEEEKDALGELVERYVKNFIGDEKSKKGEVLLKKLKDNESDPQKKEKIKLDFEKKVREQLFNQDKNLFGKDKSVSDAAKAVFANLMWLQYLPARKPLKDNNEYGVNKCNQIEDITGIKVSYSCDGRAKYGMAAMRLDEDLTDLILLFNELVQESPQWKQQNPNAADVDLQQIKEYIIKWCLDLTPNGEPVEKDGEENSEIGIRSQAYDKIKTTGRDCPTDLLPIHNMLLHLCKPQYYDDISVSGHKKKIVDTFEALLPKKGDKIDLTNVNFILDDANAYNKKYYIILNELNKLENQQANGELENQQANDKYGDNLWNENGGSDGAIGDNVKIYDYKWMWNIGADKDYSDINALKFKKAIILYGPPGTSKTYSAKNLAKNLIFQKDYLGKDKSKKSGIKDFLENKDVEKQIHRLQLHPNYTYEDFIWGYQINNEEYMNKNKEVVCVGNQTVPRKGYFLRLIDDISKENEKNKRTHVLILDEINRVDLSRLFGELFSAIENRNEPVDLLVEVEGTKQITIPDNLYIIGTMNEIDFSLERVDFALRRRFAWFFYGFSEDALKDIIEDKLKDKPINKFTDELQTKYVQSCKEFNKMIDDDPDLGKRYQIGHTFFAEIVDIWKDMSQKEIKSIQEILWNISISPMIEAYLGNCDEKDKMEKRLEPFKKAFLIEKD